MQKRHFNDLALALRTTNASLETCKAVARVCQQSNPAFDFNRFLAACGYEPFPLPQPK